MKIKNKRGWIRIFEAVIAIMILMGFAAFLITKQMEKPDFSASVHALLSTVLEESSGNLAVRQAVFEKNETYISNFISSRLPAGLNFTISICDTTGPCLLPISKPGVEIYADDILISTDLKTYAPAKLALFAWIEPRVPEEYVPVVPEVLTKCGDEKIQSPNDDGINEACDGSDLAGQTCIGLGFDVGTLACKADCTAFDTSACCKKQCPSTRADCGDGCGEKCQYVAYNAALNVYSPYGRCTISTTGCKCGIEGPTKTDPSCKDGYNNDFDNYAPDTDPECF